MFWLIFVILILKIKRSIEDGGNDTFMSVSDFWLKSKGMMCKSVSSKQVDLQKKKKKKYVGYKKKIK